MYSLCSFGLSKVRLDFERLCDGRYFKHKASTDLVDSDLHHLRKLVSEHAAKLIVDSVKGHILTDLLLKRYHF